VDQFSTGIYNNAGYTSISALKASSAFANKKPGSYFQYCNLGFGTLGAIVEKIANKRFDLYVRENIISPLGMNASYNVDHFTLDQIAHIATLYRRSGVQWIPQADDYNGVQPVPRDLSTYTIGEDAFIFSPTGGMRTTALDLAKFMMAHMNNGMYRGARILRDTSAITMHAPKWNYNGSNGANEGFWNKYGYAFQTTETLIPGQRLIGVPGEAYGLLSDMYFSPDSMYGIVFITNGGGKFASDANGFYNIENAVFNAVYSILLKTPDQITPVYEGERTAAPLKDGSLRNYPNPFNPVTTIHYTIPTSGHVTIKVYSIMGAEIESVHDGFLSGGEHASEFDAHGLPSGTYVYRITAPGYTKACKMILLN
jgi:hypothetical protein